MQRLDIFWLIVGALLFGGICAGWIEVGEPQLLLVIAIVVLGCV